MVTIIVSPSAAYAARWSLDQRGRWKSAQAVLTSPGEHQISFDPCPGWEPPPPFTYVAVDGIDAEFTAYYEKANNEDRIFGRTRRR